MSSTAFDFETVIKSLKLPSESPSPALQAHLNRVIELARPYGGNWKFPWLMSDWNAPVWLTTNGTKTRTKKNGKLVDALKVDWDILLPDGYSLLHEKYSLLLESVRRVSALSRTGLVGGKIPSMANWRKFNSILLRMCLWLVQRESRYKPAEYGFQLLDQGGVKQLLRSLALGGWCCALDLIPRVLSNLHERVFTAPIPQDLLNKPAQWPEEKCDAVVAWLSCNDGYSVEKGKSTGRVSRKLLGEIAGSNPERLRRHRQLELVLRQFEPQHQSKVLGSGSSRREFALHSSPLLEDELNKPSKRKTVQHTASVIRALLTLYRHMPDRLPNPQYINLTEASREAIRYTSEDGHTPFIPFDTGLKYLNSALRWVVLYGEDIVDYFLTVMEKIAAIEAKLNYEGSWKTAIYHHQEKIFANTPLPESLREAGFSFKSLSPPVGNGRDFDRFRTAPTLIEALSIYIGAVVIVIALLKPSRDVEVTHLPRVCLLRSRHGHYWLDSDLAKRTKGERRARTGGKPIPTITARAIQQVRKLNRGLSKIYREDDAYAKSQLFYLPNTKKWGTPVNLVHAALNPYLDEFCDYVGIPPDEYGRRWYLRIHEMRKWFLLLLFWSGRYDVIDAARWIAGHSDVEHLYAYIEREFPGGKLGALEADYAVDLLAKYDTTRVAWDDADIGLVELHERVLKHFRVESLTFVREAEWHLLVEELFDHEYHLEPYSVSCDDGSKRICVAVRLGSRSGEKS